MIQTQNIQFQYNSDSTFVFPDILCSPGETLLITGKSGSGKTTLLHLLSGLLLPKSGSITIGNTALEQLTSRQKDAYRGKHIGLILQQSYFVSSLTVLDNILLASWIASKNKAYDKAIELLQFLQISDLKDKLPNQLSVGQQQRVSIARALMNEPKVILADEPTSALDDENAELVAQLLIQVAQKYHASLLIVTHDSRLKNQIPNQIELT